MHANSAVMHKTKNSYNKMEWAGAFGDVGTLIPFVVAYITIVKVEPLGLLFMFGICLMAAGFYYRTPLPVQPMKAIGAAAIAGGISPAALFGSGITTGIFWFCGRRHGRCPADSQACIQTDSPGHHCWGLGLSFMVDGVNRMRSAPVLAGIALVVTYLLLTNPKIPAMFMLLIIGVVSAVIMNPQLMSELARIHVAFKLPVFALPTITWNDIAVGHRAFHASSNPIDPGQCSDRHSRREQRTVFPTGK